MQFNDLSTCNAYNEGLLAGMRATEGADVLQPAGLSNEDSRAWLEGLAEGRELRALYETTYKPHPAESLEHA